MAVVVVIVLVLLIMVLLPIVRNWVFSFSYRAKYNLLLVLLLISLLANAGMVGRFVVCECLIASVGQSEASPDSQWVARAESIRPLLLTAEAAHYLLKIESKEGRVVKSARIHAGKVKDAEHFRALPQIIHWSNDSKEVVFDIPGVQVRMDRELHAAQP